MTKYWIDQTFAKIYFLRPGDLRTPQKCDSDMREYNTNINLINGMIFCISSPPCRTQIVLCE